MILEARQSEMFYLKYNYIFVWIEFSYLEIYELLFERLKKKIDWIIIDEWYELTGIIKWSSSVKSIITEQTFGQLKRFQNPVTPEIH